MPATPATLSYRGTATWTNSSTQYTTSAVTTLADYSNIILAVGARAGGARYPLTSSTIGGKSVSRFATNSNLLGTNPFVDRGMTCFLTVKNPASNEIILNFDASMEWVAAAVYGCNNLQSVASAVNSQIADGDEVDTLAISAVTVKKGGIYLVAFMSSYGNEFLSFNGDLNEDFEDGFGSGDTFAAASQLTGSNTTIATTISSLHASDYHAASAIAFR